MQHFNVESMDEAAAEVLLYAYTILLDEFQHQLMYGAGQLDIRYNMTGLESWLIQGWLSNCKNCYCVGDDNDCQFCKGKNKWINTEKAWEIFESAKTAGFDFSGTNPLKYAENRLCLAVSILAEELHVQQTHSSRQIDWRYNKTDPEFWASQASLYSSGECDCVKDDKDCQHCEVKDEWLTTDQAWETFEKEKAAGFDFSGTNPMEDAEDDLSYAVSLLAEEFHLAQMNNPDLIDTRYIFDDREFWLGQSSLYNSGELDCEGRPSTESARS